MYTNIRNTKIYYEIVGQGKPVLFLHGGFDNIENYQLLKRKLVDNNFQVIAFDRRGHGRSSDNKEIFSYQKFTEEVKEFMDSIKIEKYSAIGFSDGAVIATRLAYSYPTNINKVIAISGNYSNQNICIPEWEDAVVNLSAKYVKKNFPEVAEQYLELSPQKNLEEYVKKTKELWFSKDIVDIEKLKNTKAKFLIVGGDKDFIKAEHFVYMKNITPQANLLIIPNSGHFIFQDFSYDKNAEYSLEMFIEFLNS